MRYKIIALCLIIGLLSAACGSTETDIQAEATAISALMYAAQTA